MREYKTEDPATHRHEDQHCDFDEIKDVHAVVAHHHTTTPGGSSGE